MAKKGGKSGGAKDYYGSIAGLVCAGPVDELVSIISDGKTVWEGPLARTAVGVTNPQSITVVGFGTVIFYWGTTDQVVNTTLTPELAGHPPYRRQAWCVLKDFLFGRERTSAPNIEVVVRRAPQQSIVLGDPAVLDADAQANPIAALAELVTDPVFGLGQPATLLNSTSWQATADALCAESARTHLSTVLATAASFRSAASGLIGYYDGWLRWNANGEVEAGRFLHNEAPPAFTDATTIDFHDLVEEPEFTTDGWSATENEVVVKYRDRTRAWKDAVAKAVSGYNREVVGEPRQKSVDCPFITRAAQAAGQAAELAKVAAEQGMEGELNVRAEKVTSILPGDLFLFTHEDLGLSIVCRCIRKTLESSSAGRVKIAFLSERAIGHSPFQTPTTIQEPPTSVAPERVDLYQFVQVPPVLSSDTTKIAVLAARTSALSLGLNVHLIKDDGSVMYELGTQTGWAVAGILQQDYSATAPAAGTAPPDDESETLHVTLDLATVTADLAKISATQGADAVNDSNLLLWVFRGANPSEFEMMTVKSMRIVGGETFYRFKVRRARFGTQQLALTTGDRAFIVLGSDLAMYGHSQFAAYSVAGAEAVFRLQSFNAWGEGDLADSAICPDIAYTFTDPFAPTAEWLSVKRSGIEVTDFTQEFALTDTFAVTVQATDPTNDLTNLAIVAHLGTEAITLLSVTTSATPSLTRTLNFIPSSVGMTEGDWRLRAVVMDATARKREIELTPGGGGADVKLRLRVDPVTPAACIMPAASPVGGGGLMFPVIVTLTTSTVGAAIEYQIQPLGTAAAGTWTAYSVAVLITVNSSLYARATDGVLSDSPTLREDFWLDRDDTQPPGWHRQ